VLPMGATAHQRAVKVVGGKPGNLAAVVEASDPSTIVEHIVWVRDAAGAWGHGRVTLAGDAAHAMPPTTGQGFAQAAEDAHRLATALQEHGVTPEALRAYEHTRRERVIRIQAAERELVVAAGRENSRAAMAAIMEQDDYRSFLYHPDVPPLSEGG